VRRLTKILLKQFARAARPYLESHGLLRTSLVFSRSAIVFEPDAGRVLVLAPHMDDETIGCGGTLARHMRAGATAQVVFMTDGRYGSSEISRLSGEARRNKELELVQVRKEEARRALRILGVEDVVFLDAEDSRLDSTPWVAERLRQVIEKFRPDIVYLPFFLEQHPDHLAVSRVLLDATRLSSLDFQCFGYEVWTPLFPNCLVKIDDVMELKKQALTQHASQLADANYMHTALALNAYRSAGLIERESRYAEAFTVVGLAQYRKMFEAYLRS
jgi:LmbE family N-acetylglucosaminyl deacetylase